MTRFLHKPRKKGQSAVEAGLIMMVVLFLTSAFVGVLSSQIGEAHVKNYEKSLATLAELVETEINIALASEDGYTHEFRLPPTLAGKPYKIEFINASTLNKDLPEDKRYKYNVSILRVYSAQGDAAFVVEKTFQRLIEGDFVKGLNTLRKKEGAVVAEPKLVPGTLSIALNSPTSDFEVKKLDTFVIIATVQCTENPASPATSCGDISMFSMQKDGGAGEPVPGSGTPFTTPSPNERQCGELVPGGACQQSWTVTATGGAGNFRHFYAKATALPPYSTNAESAQFKATILPYCTDNTPANTCSPAKPKYCQGSDLELVNKCGTCGCPNPAYSCAPDGACKLAGVLAVTLTEPVSDMKFDNNVDTHTLTAQAKCEDTNPLGPSELGCGEVDVTAMQKGAAGASDVKIPTSGSHPFKASTPNPQLCGAIATGASCYKSWTITAGGAVGEVRELYAKAASTTYPLSAESAAVKAYITAPTITSVTPASGSTNGGYDITITGTDFKAGAVVTVGGKSATVTSLTATQVTVTVPATASAGLVDVKLANSDGGADTKAAAFTYIAAPPPAITSISPVKGPKTGGTAVTLTGTGFAAGMAVKFGASPATISSVSETQAAVTTSAAATTGVVGVTVTNPDGKAATLASAFTYTAPPPTITSISPKSGSTSGWTPVTITGTGFAAGMAVKFGTLPAAGTVSVDSSTQAKANTPAASAGVVDVMVTNPDGNFATLHASFTYLPIWKVFVTSLTYKGDLGGLAGADARCKSAADLAAPATGLPGKAWAAWLSTGTANAKDRIADGYYMLVGTQFIADSKADLLDGTLAAPIQYNDQGTVAGPGLESWTGTDKNGLAVPDSNCNSWASSDGPPSGPKATAGSVTKTDYQWTNKDLITCDKKRALYCFEVPVWKVFVTSAGIHHDGAGAIGGLANADARCKTLADAVPALAGKSWAAWLSTSTTNAKDRIKPGYYVRTDGAVIATSKADLLDGQLAEPITYNEKVVFHGLAAVWTGTTKEGLAVTGKTCSDWTSTTASGAYGETQFTNDKWTNKGNYGCNVNWHMFCFQTG